MQTAPKTDLQLEIVSVPDLGIEHSSNHKQVVWRIDILQFASGFVGDTHDEAIMRLNVSGL